jgi:methyl-accepting chemotaxis protein
MNGLFTSGTIKKVIHLLFTLGIMTCCIQFLKVRTLSYFVITSIFTSTYVIYLIREHKIKKTYSKYPESIPEKNENITNKSNEKIESVSNTIKNNVNVIPVLNEQLKAVITQTDEAANGLIGAFIRINQQAKKQMQSVQELFGNLSEQSGMNALTETQKELQEIQKNFTTMTSFFDRSIGMISDVVNQLSRVDEFALKIKKISQVTNILALNASIEAAHTGDEGSGFKVIATEINALSRESNSSIKEIAEITEKLTSNVNSIKHELESVNRDTISIGDRTEKLFGMAMEQIGETLHNATEKMSTIANNAEVLNKEISKVVVSIQFQDITRQRIEHVISPLETLQNEFTETIKNIENGPDNEKRTTVERSADSLMSQYTMEAEREVLRKMNNQKS